MRKHEIFDPEAYMSVDEHTDAVSFLGLSIRLSVCLLDGLSVYLFVGLSCFLALFCSLRGKI